MLTTYIAFQVGKTGQQGLHVSHPPDPSAPVKPWSGAAVYEPIFLLWRTVVIAAAMVYMLRDPDIK